MFKISFSTSTAVFAYHLLWSILSLFHFLDEEVTEENIGKYYKQNWSVPFEKLAHLLSDKWHYFLKQAKVSPADKEKLYHASNMICNSLIYYFGGKMISRANDIHEADSPISKAMWVYYYYCRFLFNALQEFNQIINSLGSSSLYYKRYQESLKLFNALANAMEREYPLPENSTQNTMLKNIRMEIDSFADELSSQWGKSVQVAAKHHRLPDFIDDPSALGRSSS